MSKTGYGETRWSEGTLLTDFGFTGQRHDGTGLIFMHARYYHPALGRWTQADTIVPNLANLQEWNRYGYALNNPTRYIDPSGHQIEPPEYQPGNIAHTGTVGPHVVSSETTVQYTDNVAADPSFVYRSPLDAKIRQFYVDNSVPGLPQDLVDNYYRELGDIKLTPAQMMKCNPHVDIRRSEDFGAEYHSLRGGGEKYIEIQGPAIAGTNGTLGKFTVNYKGDLRVDAEGDWFFDGTVGFYDIYDFNPLYGEDRRDLVPEFKVRFTNVVLPGDSFTITSEEIPATQSNYSTLATYPGFTTYRES